MAKLTSKARKNLPTSAFAIPGKRKYPIHDRAHAIDALARASGKPEEAQVRAAVKRRYPGISLKKAMREIELAKSSSVDVRVPLWKDDAKQIVYGVVLTPDLRDSQGDIVTAEEIEKAAHKFLVNYRKHDVQHNERAAGVETVESFVAPQDLEIAGQPVTKGSWVMATHISDADVWAQVQKDELGGYSIGGSGVRIPEAT